MGRLKEKYYKKKKSARFRKGMVHTVTAAFPLTDEQILQFLEHFKHEEVLWNPKNESYSNIQSRREAIEWIVSAMNIPGFEFKQVKAKLYTYRDLYRKELNKPTTSDPEASDPVPFWFEKMSFLKDNLNDVKYLNFIKEVDDEDIDNEKETERIIIKEEIVEEDINLDELIESQKYVQEDMERGDVQIVNPNNPLIVNKKNELDGYSIQSSQGVMVLEPSTSRSTTKRPSSTLNLRPKKQKVDVKTKVDDDNVHEEPSSSTENNQLWAIAKCQEEILKILSKQETKGDGYFDNFARYVASLLKALPRDKACSLQPKIIALITNEHMKLASTSTSTSQ